MIANILLYIICDEYCRIQARVNSLKNWKVLPKFQYIQIKV